MTIIKWLRLFNTLIFWYLEHAIEYCFQFQDSSVNPTPISFPLLTWLPRSKFFSSLFRRWWSNSCSEKIGNCVGILKFRECWADTNIDKVMNVQIKKLISPKRQAWQLRKKVAIKLLLFWECCWGKNCRFLSLVGIWTDQTCPTCLKDGLNLISELVFPQTNWPEFFLKSPNQKIFTFSGKFVDFHWLFWGSVTWWTRIAKKCY